MPTTVLIPSAVSSLNAHHANYGGGGAASLSDANSGTGYIGTGETNDTGSVPPSKSYFTTQGLPPAALPPFSNPRCFGWISNVQHPLPNGEYNEAATGLDNAGTESVWNRWNHDGGADTIVSNNAYASSPYGGIFTTPTTVAAVNAVRVMLQTGRNISGGDGGRSMAEAYWKIDHAAAKGMTIAMLFQWLGPLVAVGLHEMPGLTRELFRRSLTLIRPDEHEWAWRALRDHRAPRSFQVRGWPA
jgi:hypothetical protein